MSKNNVLTITDGRHTRLFLNGTEIKNVYSLSNSFAVGRKSVNVEIACDKAESLHKKDGVTVEEMVREYFGLPKPAPAVTLTNQTSCTLEQLYAAGWTDEMLVAHGYVVRKDAPQHTTIGENLLKNALTLIREECQGKLPLLDPHSHAAKIAKIVRIVTDTLDSFTFLKGTEQCKPRFEWHCHVTDAQPTPRHPYYNALLKLRDYAHTMKSYINGDIHAKRINEILDDAMSPFKDMPFPGGVKRAEWGNKVNFSETLHVDFCDGPSKNFHALTRDEAQLLVATGHRTFAWYDKNFPVSK